MKKMFQVAAVAGLLVLGQSVLFAAGPSRDFSADMVSVSGGQTMQGRMYVSQDKTRMETAQSVVITRMDRNVAWILMPEQNMYMEQPIDPKMVARTSKEMPGEIERVPMGTEAVNGISAQKFKVTTRGASGEETMFQWIGDADIPVKMASVDGSWSVEYKNISTAPQPESVFEVPAGYQKFAVPSMANMMDAARQAAGAGE